MVLKFKTAKVAEIGDLFHQGTCMMVSIHSRPLRIASTPITNVGQPRPKATQASRVRVAGLQSTRQPMGNATWTCSDSKDIAGSAMNKAFVNGTTWQFPDVQKRLPLDVSLTTRIKVILSRNIIVSLPFKYHTISYNISEISLYRISDTGLQDLQANPSKSKQPVIW